MMLRKWDTLPDNMKTPEVRHYYEILRKKRASLFFKRVSDIVLSVIMLILLSPVFAVLAVAIKLDSKGPVFFRQTRVTQYGRRFRIFKFRTMVTGADNGSQVTLENDSRITRVGAFLRRFRLDEISQLIDVLRGSMTFVGTRPEVPLYVERYTPEMYATLLLPAGITSRASICFRDEAALLENAEDSDALYTEVILPKKMYYNLKDIENFSLWNDIKTMFMTVFAVLGKDYADEQPAAEILPPKAAKLTEEEPKQHDTKDSEPSGQTDHRPAYQP